MTTPEYRFGSFVLRPATRELLAGGQAQRVGARAFDVLLALVERGGGIASRDELFERAWPGRVVIDDNLKVQVMGLRRLLGAEAIVTVPGHGYRFGWPVEKEEGAPSAIDGAVAAAATGVVAGAVAGAGSAAAAGATRTARGADARGTPALIGREGDLAELLALLQPGRLVTIAGSGGVGKTRLALAAAAAAAAAGAPAGTARAFADGATVVELAPVGEPRLVSAVVARRLGLPIEVDGLDAAGLARAIAPLSLLLVLDNCEHLLAGAADLAETLLAQAPRCALLATSQEPLNLRGEVVLRLSGLALPPADAPTTAVAASPAVTLLAERVRAQDRAFVVDERNAAAAASLARRLDGIPLALEWAAARVPLLGVQGVLERLDEQLRLLSRGAHDAPTRQQTLRAALQWSHALLDASQKAVFRRLGVFADSFTLDTAEVVCTADGDDPWDVLDALQALVDKSLVDVVRVGRPGGGPGLGPGVGPGGGPGVGPGGALEVESPSGERRLRLLVTAREFALERLAEAGEAEATRARHADAVLAVFESSLAHIPNSPLLPWLERLWPELPEVRAALRWAGGINGAEGDPARLVALVSLVGAIGPFWNIAGLNREAQRWLERVRPLIDERTPKRHAARYWQALALRAVDPLAPAVEAVAAAQRAAALYQELGDDFGEYRMLGVQAVQVKRSTPPLDAAPLVARMRELERPEWSATWRSTRLRAEGIVFSNAGDWRRYRDHFAADLERAREAGDDLHAWTAHINVAVADIALGRAAQAAADLQPVVDRLRESGYLRWQWRCAAVLMAAWIEAGDWTRASAAMRETLSLLGMAGAADFIGDHLAWWATANGAPEEGARLLGWCDEAPARRKTAGRAEHDVHACRRHEALLAQALPAERVADLRASGRAWSDERALQCLLGIVGKVS